MHSDLVLYFVTSKAPCACWVELLPLPVFELLEPLPMLEPPLEPLPVSGVRAPCPFRGPPLERLPMREPPFEPPLEPVLGLVVLGLVVLELPPGLLLLEPVCA